MEKVTIVLHVYCSLMWVNIYKKWMLLFWCFVHFRALLFLTGFSVDFLWLDVPGLTRFSPCETGDQLNINNTLFCQFSTCKASELWLEIMTNHTFLYVWRSFCQCFPQLLMFELQIMLLLQQAAFLLLQTSQKSLLWLHGAVTKWLWRIKCIHGQGLSPDSY